jgi:hypothetical protein
MYLNIKVLQVGISAQLVCNSNIFCYDIYELKILSYLGNTTFNSSIFKKMSCNAGIFILALTYKLLKIIQAMASTRVVTDISRKSHRLFFIVCDPCHLFTIK